MNNAVPTQTDIQQDIVYALAQSGDSLFAARLSGLYHSADNGQSWHNTFESLDQPLAATAVAANRDMVFAGVNGAVLRSENREETWQINALASPSPQVIALVISPNFSNDQFIAAGTADDGVFISTDLGENWTAWNFGLFDPHIYALAISPDFQHDRTIYAGTESGIFRSHNGGRGWQDLPFPVSAAPVLSLGISPDFLGDSRLYAGTQNSGLYCSEDRGIHWQSVTEVPNESAINAIQFSGFSKDVWMLADDQLLRTSNPGLMWTQAASFADKQATTMLIDFGSTGLTWIGFADGTLLAFPGR